MLRLFSPSDAMHLPDRAKLLSQTTAIIKTFQRPKDLDRLIRSMRRYYPQLQILVGDDGFEPSPRTDVGYLRLPEDIGLSAGRNALLDRVQTPYFLLLDDDWQFIRKTQIEKLTQLVDEGELDIAAGNHIKIKRKFYFYNR
ncbi:MAG TPA: glycosyltransferase, partial [Pirellulales bacterium]